MKEILPQSHFEKLDEGITPKNFFAEVPDTPIDNIEFQLWGYPQNPPLVCTELISPVESGLFSLRVSLQSTLGYVFFMKDIPLGEWGRKERVLLKSKSTEELLEVSTSGFCKNTAVRAIRSSDGDGLSVDIISSPDNKVLSHESFSREELLGDWGE